MTAVNRDIRKMPGTRSQMVEGLKCQVNVARLQMEGNGSRGGSEH